MAHNLWEWQVGSRSKSQLQVQAGSTRRRTEPVAHWWWSLYCNAPVRPERHTPYTTGTFHQRHLPFFSSFFLMSSCRYYRHDMSTPLSPPSGPARSLIIGLPERTSESLRPTVEKKDNNLQTEE